MSRLPYLCHFRAIIHTFDGTHEDFDLSTWVDGFEFRSLKQFEKDKKDLSKYLDIVCNIKMVEGSHSYFNDRTTSAMDYGKECISEGDIIARIIESDIKPDDQEHYYEIIGKYHFHSYQNYEGEWDSDDDVTDVKFQELSKEDVDAWAKDQGIHLNP
jgi:hypothetical protein